MNISLNSLVSVSDFNKGKAGRIFSRVSAKGEEVVVMKNNRPEAVVVSMKRWQGLIALEEELSLELLVRDRLANPKGATPVPFNTAMRHLGVSKKALAEAEPFEIE